MYRGRDITSRKRGENLREEISMRREKGAANEDQAPESQANENQANEGQVE